MITHVSIGVRDVDRSRAFYDAAPCPARVQVYKGCEDTRRLRLPGR